MKIIVNDTLHGFEFSEKKELSDISATAYIGKHKKSGCEIIFLDREDVNKTFLISFATIPEDDTGVFHILEHSVLCGSERYPVKEPFVELLKGSLSTFLNAMTYNDKTVYPVSSKCDRDFLGLVSVYLDAVLHPRMLKEERIFRQEGWHYEYDGSSLSYNGVVYNEMKGAYSSADDVANERLMKMLYPDTCYSKDSGGNPDAIPTLTYEGFKAAHRRYYHPSNAKIILDGSVNLDEILPLIDSYLSEYDATDMGVIISDQTVAPSSEASIEYEIAATESEEGKERLILGYLTFGADELEKNIAASIIRDYLTGSNEAPLKKALLDTGLCEDVSMYELDGIKRYATVIDVRNVKEGAFDKLTEIVYDVIEGEISRGLKRERLIASINSLEYRLREADYGTYPKGLMYSLSMLDTWLYGLDPTMGFRFTELLHSMREHLKGDFYEKTLAEMIVNNERQTLKLHPSKTLAERRKDEEEKELKRIKDALSERELDAILEGARALTEWQSAENTPEALATLPKLTLDDISTEPEIPKTDVLTYGEATLLYHHVPTAGIIYSSLVFDASDLTPTELYDLNLATSLMLNVKTENYDTLTLQERIKTYLGLLAPQVTQYRSESGSPIPALTVKAHALTQNKRELCSLVSEVVYTSDLTDKAAIKKILSQTKIALEESFISAGHSLAMGRADAHVSAISAIEEYLGGYEAYKITKSYEENFDEISDALIERMTSLLSRTLVRERLTVNLACPYDEELFTSLVNIAKEGGAPAGECKIKPLPPENEAIVIPSRVAYAAASNWLSAFGGEFHGSSQVARAILNFEHLWSSIRVRGGAYGAGVMMRKTGRVSFYSYRDPKPRKSFDVYRECADFLRSYANECEDLTSLIIGAVGNFAPLFTPRLTAELSLARYFAKTTYESEKRILEELIGTTTDDLLRIADTIEAAVNGATLCLVGSAEHAAECSDIITKTLEL